MAEAKAHVYPCQNEDFGMVPVESMAAGTPVIGVAEGFTQHQIQGGRNGLLFERGELGAALRAFERDGVAWSGQQIAAFARQNFGVEQFRREMRAAVAEARERATVSCDWELPDEAADQPAADQPALTDGGPS